MYDSKVKSAETDELYNAIMSLQSQEECYRFFDDLCTFGEINAMAQRFHVAQLLEEGKTFAQISEETGASSATITRVNKCVTYGSDGYKLVLERM
jgi:TrpR-related protein YerC/YecD